MRRAARSLSRLLPVALVLAAPAPALAQEAPTLDRVEAAADSGRVDSARAMLERWRADRSEGASARALSRARFLRARLTADADSAAERYLRVAVEGTGAYGDRAWLRVAQLRLAGEEPERALRALERLRSDYPGTDLTAESWLWTARAREVAGSAAEACSAWRRTRETAPASGRSVRRQAREALRACDAGEARAAADTAARAGEPAAAPADAARSGWAVQLGAFSEHANAERLRRAVGERVSEAELVIVPPGAEDELFRLQTRPPTDRSAARRLARELEARGISAFAVRVRP